MDNRNEFILLAEDMEPPESPGSEFWEPENCS